VPGVAGQRPVLPIPGHAGIHQARIALAQLVRADAQPFGYPGPVHVDEGVRVGDEAVNQVPAARILDVGGKRPLATTHRVIDGERTIHTRETINTDHVGAQVAQQHSAERSGAQAAHHDDAHAA
jgi:hypothetical protein